MDHAKETAVVLVDVQLGLFKKPTPLYKAEQLLSTLNLLIRKARLAGVPVIYVQHSSPKASAYGSEEWQLHPQLLPPRGDCVIHKLHGNAFEETDLQDELARLKIRNLVIGGLVTNGCVRATTLAALELGYAVTLVKDGHSSYAKEAAALIDEWNAKLSGAGATVKPVSSIQFL
jgi:nicotinamidase-related amidase